MGWGVLFSNVYRGDFVLEGLLWGFYFRRVWDFEKGVFLRVFFLR